MSEKWTPGPWRIGRNHGPLQLIGHHRILMHGAGSAAVYSMGCDEIETEANARLIAAAPNMAKALEIADRRIAELCEMICTLAGNPRKARAADYSGEVRAALSAARGEG